MSNFDEKSGVVPCLAPWGKWYQTMEDVVLEVDVPEGTLSKSLDIRIRNSSIQVAAPGDVRICGDLFGTVHASEALWTLEDRRLVRICLPKTDVSAKNTWPCLFKDGGLSADAWTLDQMQRKMTLERFQRENPGFDFSNAEISGNYAGGGPDLPSS